MRAPTRRLPALVLALALAACGTTSTSAAPVRTPAAEPTPGETPPAGDDPVGEPPGEPQLVADWDPGAAPLALPGGSTLGDCDGDVPALCVIRDGVEVGSLQHSSFPVPTGLAEDDVDGLRAFAAARVDDVAADRSVGCGADHVVTGEPVVELDVDGRPGVRYGFTTRTGDVVVEQVAVWAVVRGEQLDLVVAEATAPPGCMHGELLTFAPADLDALLPVLDRVMAATALPPG